MDEEQEEDILKKKIGRPYADIGLKELENLVGMGCTDDEIASFFGVTSRTIRNKRQEEPYKTIFETAFNKFKISLRRAQLHSALKKNNSTLLVWLGKVYLGQKDNIKLSGDPENPLEFNGKIEIVHVVPDHKEKE